MMVHKILAAETKKDLENKILSYAKEYHPFGYGTSFRVEDSTGKVLRYIDPFRGITNVEIPVSEDGLFEVHVSRASSCD